MMTKAGVIPLKQFQGPDAEISDDIVIGKDILDLLTGAMYVDPLSIYREYIQNSADAIQEAREAGLYSAAKPAWIKIYVDPKARSVTILDNGIGVPQKDFVRCLTAIGASRKRGADLRGFRGVGRLSGLGYCQELVFRSRAGGDRKVSELTWDGKKLKDLLRSDSQTELTEAIKSIAKTRVVSAEGRPEHFFEVELRSLGRVHNDVLLNDGEIHSYLSQVAPVPFSPDFRFGEAIADFLARYTKYDTVDITIGPSGKIFRPHSDQFPITDKVSDTFAGITFFQVPGMEDDIDAVGWLLTHSYLGAISKRAHVEGLRARVGNIQIGTADVFDSLFTQPRFNSWCVGEVHVLSKRILPNGRRDNFEVNGHLQNLHGHLAKTAKDLIKICRDKSVIRNRLKSAALLVESAHQSISLLEQNNFSTLKQYFEAFSSKLLGQLDQLVRSSSLSEAERTLVANRSKALADRLRLTSRNGVRRRDPLAKVGAVKRRAYEEAIDAVLSSALPISVRADLTQRIIRRATHKSIA